MADNARKVTNTSSSALGLPSGEVVPAGGSVNVKDWSKSENNDVVKAWIKAGALKVGASTAEDDEKDETADKQISKASSGSTKPSATDPKKSQA